MRAGIAFAFALLVALANCDQSQTAAPANYYCKFPAGYMVGQGYASACASTNEPPIPSPLGPAPSATPVPIATPVPMVTDPCQTSATLADIIACQEQLYGISCQSSCADSSVPSFDPVTFAITVLNYSQAKCDTIISACNKVYTNHACYYNSNYQYFALKDYTSGALKCSTPASPSDWPRVVANSGPALTAHLTALYGTAPAPTTGSNPPPTTTTTTGAAPAPKSSAPSAASTTGTATSTTTPAKSSVPSAASTTGTASSTTTPAKSSVPSAASTTGTASSTMTPATSSTSGSTVSPVVAAPVDSTSGPVTPSTSSVAFVIPSVISLIALVCLF